MTLQNNVSGIVYGKDSNHYDHLSKVATSGGSDVVNPDVARIRSHVVVTLKTGVVRLEVADNWFQLNLRRIANKTT